jgi:hypothetical protein
MEAVHAASGASAAGTLTIWSQAEATRRLHGQESHWRTVRDALVVSCVGSAVFGAALGCYAMTARQVLASALKVPLLLLGTAVLCFPAFYVLQALRDTEPLSLDKAAAIQSLALATTASLWAVLAPPLLFLITSCADYKLAQVLALLIGLAGGCAGLARFFSAYRTATERSGSRRHSWAMLTYLVTFTAVGGQLAWVLRPFIGDPSLDFTLLRHLGGNMFSHILSLLG